jgi:hypothetical protein
MNRHTVTATFAAPKDEVYAALLREFENLERRFGRAA